MRAVFIRHGQSTGNAGIPCHDLSAIELTELGPLRLRYETPRGRSPCEASLSFHAAL